MTGWSGWYLRNEQRGKEITDGKNPMGWMGRGGMGWVDASENEMDENETRSRKTKYFTHINPDPDEDITIEGV